MSSASLSSLSIQTLDNISLQRPPLPPGFVPTPSHRLESPEDAQDSASLSVSAASNTGSKIFAVSPLSQSLAQGSAFVFPTQAESLQGKTPKARPSSASVSSRAAFSSTANSSAPKRKERTSIQGRSPLHIAIETGNVSEALSLIAAKQYIHSMDDFGQTPLFSATIKGNTLLIQRLIEANADVNTQDKQKQSPLVLAATWESHESTALLLKHKADASLTNTQRQTPLHIATTLKNLPLINMLTQTRSPMLPDAYGKTPLQIAIDTDDHQVVAHFLTMVDLNNPSPRHAVSPLQRALIQKSSHSALLLLGKMDAPHTQDQMGNTPLHLAVDGGLMRVIQALLNREAPILSQNVEGNTPLHLAAQKGFEDIVQLLLQYKADPKKTNNLHQTPLLLAQEKGFLSTATTLQKAIDAQSDGCWSLCSCFFSCFAPKEDSMSPRSHSPAFRSLHCPDSQRTYEVK